LGGASRLIVACLVATVAFWAYTRTLLPGVDLGDTGGFQAAVLWPEVSARQAYPLYYTLARPFVATVSAGNPARGLNLFSAITGAAAVGLLAFACSTVTGSLAAGAVAGLLLAFSYTFWSQAIIAEVYGLHLALIVICLLALHGYAATPTAGRLALFFALYALSFGNHLGMILFVVPFAMFLPRKELRKPGTIALALGIAAAGALQYLPNLLAVWSSIDAPDGWTGRLAAFWFDVTKQDWRESMVLEDVAPLGDAAAPLVRDLYAVRAHVQRRRQPRILPARASHHGILCRGLDRVVQSGRCRRASAALCRLARMVHLALRRSPRRPPRRSADRPPDAGRRGAAGRPSLADELAARERAAVREPLPAAGAGMAAPGGRAPSLSLLRRGQSRRRA
jgi:hypothetical protein